MKHFTICKIESKSNRIPSPSTPVSVELGKEKPIVKQVAHTFLSNFVTIFKPALPYSASSFLSCFLDHYLVAISKLSSTLQIVSLTLHPQVC